MSGGHWGRAAAPPQAPGGGERRPAGSPRPLRGGSQGSKPGGGAAPPALLPLPALSLVPAVSASP